ncbi:MAG: hypothetical protein K8R31_07290 [Bacteroidales bacterium]|nr:hypothetical protein [Bacteroidales bacterium]
MKTKKTKKDPKKNKKEIDVKDLENVTGGKSIVKFKAGSDLADAVNKI